MYCTNERATDGPTTSTWLWVRREGHSSRQERETEGRRVGGRRTAWSGGSNSGRAQPQHSTVVEKRLTRLDRSSVSVRVSDKENFVSRATNTHCTAGLVRRGSQTDEDFGRPNRVREKSAQISSRAYCARIQYCSVCYIISATAGQRGQFN